MKRFWKSFGWFWMSTLPMVACVVLQLVLGAIVMIGYGMVRTIQEQVRSEVFDQQDFTRVFMENMLEGAIPGMFAYHIVGIVVFGLWYYLACYRTRESKQKWSAILNMKSVGIAVLIGIGLCMLSTQLVEVASYFVPQLIDDFYKMIEQAGFGTSILASVTAVMLAPVGEELLCRGVIQHYAGKVSNKFWIVNTIQALMFGIMHLNLVQGVYAFLIGLVLGWLRYRYGSLLIPMVVHFVINFSSAFWLDGILGRMPEKLWMDGLVLLAAVGLTAVGIVLVGKTHEKELWKRTGKDIM